MVTGAHLVGSIPLRDEEEVFRTTSEILGGRLRRLPDGETGARSDWIGWQIPGTPVCTTTRNRPPDPEHGRPTHRVRLRDGATASEVTFGQLGYATAAMTSYATFQQLKNDGIVRYECRFQVSLPTPLAPIGAFVKPGNDQAALEPVYEARLLEELDEIAAAIPHSDLAVQWDTAIEFAILKGLCSAWFDDPLPSIADRLIRIGRRVPDDVPVGYHLCYSDYGHQHFTQPADAELLVVVANRVTADLGRPPSWIHMPVRRERDDAGYFAPLADLHRADESELYLGLIHFTDGIDGARRRLKAAGSVIEGVGVATECGLGRRPPETIRPLLRLHDEVCAAAG